MKILICSDSHNKSILKLPLDDFDYIIHCGDILASDIDYFLLYPNLIYVRGNCDLNNYPLVETKTIFGKKLFITHGNLYQVKDGLTNLIKNTVNQYDFVFYGHTHKSSCIKEGNTYYINPGAFKNNEYAYICEQKLFFVQNAVIVKEVTLI